MEQEIQLDKKDRKIIEQLEINARQSNTQIARQVGLSKDAVSYRIKNLEKAGVIKGYYSVLNISKLGYLTYKLMLSFQNTNLKTEEDIVNYLKKDKNVGWLVSCEGDYNLIAVLWVESPFAFEKFLQKFLEKYSKHIKGRDIMMITENHSSRKNYLFGKSNNLDIFYGNERKEELDEKDKQIIYLLANNSTIPLYEISEKIKLTPEAVSHRIKQLVSRNLIQAFRPIINSLLLGYEYYNVLFRLKKFENVEKIFLFFNSCPNIIYFVKYLGSFDVGIDLEVKNSQELRKILQEIRDLFSQDIESYIPILIHAEHKISYFPE